MIIPTFVSILSGMGLDYKIAIFHSTKLVLFVGKIVRLYNGNNGYKTIVR